jgi:hypothetical protein
VTEDNRSIAGQGPRDTVVRGNPRGVRRVALFAAAVAAAGCTGDIDPPWQLSHNRIIAVRAEPPGITAGQTARIDALLGHKGAMTSVATPELAAVTSPMSLSGVLSVSDGSWTVTAPSDDRMAAARSELKLADGAPVPLEIGVSYDGQSLVATKTIMLGQAAANPTLNSVTINGQPPADQLTVGKLVKVPLAIDADDVNFDVTWLTSCGTMHDFDLPNAYLKVEADDPDTGELGVVLRDAHGGVAWQLWPIQAQ